MGEFSKIDQKIRSLGGDPGFVRFILANEGVVDTFSRRALSAAEERKSFRGNAGRRLRRKAGDDWPAIKSNRSEMARVSLEYGLFSIRPCAPKKIGAQGKHGVWRAARLLRGYFELLTKKFHMELVSEIVAPDISFEGFLRGYYRHRKEADQPGFCLHLLGGEVIQKTRLETLLGRWQQAKSTPSASVMALDTGKPIYELLGRPPVEDDTYAGQQARRASRRRGEGASDGA